ncbi:MAG: DUF1772 domain-containing protein [Bacteroidetes bacterium]|nr:DUF1772 domain-containing protein [Bacteroidota bacterium]
MKTTFTRIFNLILVGLLAGSMMEEYFVVKVNFSLLPSEQWGALHAMFPRFHLPLIIPIAILATISLIILLYFERKNKGLAKTLTWISVPLFAGIIIITGAFLMPLNFAIAEWESTGTPTNWEETKNQWIFLQGFRALLSIGGFMLLTVAFGFSKEIPKKENVIR